jgi:hypothetical protein
MKARIKVGPDGIAHVYLEDGSELTDIISVEVPEIMPGWPPQAIVRVYAASVDVAADVKVETVHPEHGGIMLCAEKNSPPVDGPSEAGVSLPEISTLGAIPPLITRSKKRG